MTASSDVYEAPREWTRVHPLSPLLGGWAVIAAVGSWWLNQNAPGLSEGEDPLTRRIGVILGVAVGLAALAIGLSYLSWWFHTFRLTDTAIEERKGLLFRQSKQARLDRVQAVDVVQPLVSRLVGLAQLTVEVAGGSGSGIKLQYLRLAHAEALRNELLALAAGIRIERAATRADAAEGDAADAPRRHGVDARLSLAPAPGSARTAVAAAVERPLVNVPNQRTIVSVLLSISGLITAVALIGFAVAVVITRLLSEDLDLLAWVFGGGSIGVAVGLFGWISAIAKNLNDGLNFRLGLAADGVRVAHGLLQTTKQTIPPGRVQAVKFDQRPLWRGRDWWRVTINVAGYGEESAESTSVLLPVGTREESLVALWSIIPDLGEPDPLGLLGTALGGQGDEAGFTAVPSSARWLDPFQYRRLGVRATPTALLIREGWLGRSLTVVPHERTQSLELRQGPLQRRLGLATVEVHSTPGPVKPVARHLAIADAILLLDNQASRARERRTRQTPAQWLAAVGLDEPSEGLDKPGERREERVEAADA